MATIQEIIVATRSECEAEAVREGWDASEPYELTAGDCDYIAEAVERQHGRKPTLEEWRSVLGRDAWVGDAHCDG